MPDGVPMDDRMYSVIEPHAKEAGMTQRELQRATDLYVHTIAEQQKIWQETVEGWGNKAREDEYFGRANFQQNVATVQQHVAQFGDAEFRGLLNDMGIGNHPAVLRYMLRVAKATGEGRAPVAAATPAASKPDPAQVLYGNRNTGSS